MQGCQWRNATDIINDFIGNNGGLGKNTAAVSDAVAAETERLRAVEREVEKQEAAVAAYDPLIEAADSDYQELARLMAEKTEAEEKLSQLMEQWEELSLALEGEG